MPDREKVIKGLECCIIEGDAEEVCPNCPYVDKHPFECTTQLMMDALALLREHEPKWIDYEDTFTGEKFKVPLCWDCESLLGDALYCPRCGRKVKWDADD